MMMLRYRDYLGSAEVDMEHNVLHGKLLFIRDLVTYEGDSPAALQKAFEDSVDEYLSDCEELGRVPDKPCKGQFNVRISPELHRELAVSAVKSEKSLNEYVSLVLGCHKNLVTGEQNHRATREALLVTAQMVLAGSGGKPSFVTISSDRSQSHKRNAIIGTAPSTWAQNNTDKVH